MRATRDEVMMYAAGLQPGETIRISCPACKGGNNRERTFSLTRDEHGAVLWHCFRANCGYAGSTGGASRLVHTSRVPRQQSRHVLTDELSRLTDIQCAELYERTGWDEECRRIARPLWCEARRRYAFPMYDPMGRRKGYVLRSYQGAQPKALTYVEEGDTNLSWYMYHTGAVVIVEDIPSAVRAAKYGNAVALNGTGSGPNSIAELSAHARQVVWCLDKDATATAIRAMTRNRLAFDASYVVPLQHDLKDMGEESLMEFLGEVYGKCGSRTVSGQPSAEVL